MISRTLFFLSLLTLIGCDRGISQSDGRGEISTLDILLSQEVSDNERTAISFTRTRNNNSESTATQIRATFSADEGLFFEMETDRSFQGYEFLAFVAPDTINSNQTGLFLLDYAIETDTRIRRLTAFNNAICEIGPVFEHDQQVFDEADRANSPLLHRSVINVFLANQDQDCSGEQTQIQVDFGPDNGGIGGINLTQIGAPQATETIVRFQISTGTDEDGNDLIDGQTFYIESSAGQLRMIDRENLILWSIPIPDSSEFANVTQVSNGNVVIQTNERVYIRDVNDLVDASNFFPNSDSGSQTLEQSVFGNVFYTLVTSNLANPSLTASDGSSVAFNDGNDIIFHENDSDRFDLVVSLDGSVSSFSFDLFSAQELVLIRQFNDRHELALFERVEGGEVWSESPNLLGGLSADFIETKILDNDLYINTFNLGQNGNNLFWQAHFFESLNLDRLTFDNSSFVLASRVDSVDTEVFIINSANLTSNGVLENPGLFVFDVTRNRGISVNTDGNNPTDDRIGTFNTFLDFTPISATLINDEFMRYEASTNIDGTEIIDFTIDAQFHIDPRVQTRSSNNQTFFEDNVAAIEIRPEAVSQQTN